MGSDKAVAIFKSEPAPGGFGQGCLIMSEEIACDMIERRDDMPAAGTQHDTSVCSEPFRSTHRTVPVHEHNVFELCIDTKPASPEPVCVRAVRGGRLRCHASSTCWPGS